MITKFDNKRCRKWPEHLGSITNAYNSTRSQIMGYSPYFLMMGRRPWLAIDLLFPTTRTLPGTKGVNNTLKPYTGNSEKQSNLHASLLNKKQHDINISTTVEQESRNSAVEIRC